MSEILKDVIRNNSGHWVANSYIDGNLWLIYSDYGTPHIIGVLLDVVH